MKDRKSMCLLRGWLLSFLRKQTGGGKGKVVGFLVVTMFSGEPRIPTGSGLKILFEHCFCVLRNQRLCARLLPLCF